MKKIKNHGLKQGSEQVKKKTKTDIGFWFSKIIKPITEF